MVDALWPPLPLEAWRGTKETLHRYAQIVGKLQLALTPEVNHFWNVGLRVTARGLATTALPYGNRVFDVELDLVEHLARARTSDGQTRTVELRPLAVADFLRELMGALDSLGIRVRITDRPVEIATEAIPFSEDCVHASYDREQVARFFRVLSSAARALDQFRARFVGKCSGVQFYWGTFDLSVGRYSGRRVVGAPARTRIEREAYSHEVSESGFWPGDAVHPAPAFFTLHHPQPDGYDRAAIRPAFAHWVAPSRCFVLPYEQCRQGNPDAAILEFLQSTYEAGATRAGWDRAALEREP
jgi:hypothetical protein